MKKYSLIIMFLVFGGLLPATSYADLLPLTNYKSGISMTLSGVNGVDYAVERFYHDPTFDDHSVVYLNGDVKISLEHNEHNVISTELYILHRDTTAWPWDGPDGIPRSGDERIIGITGPDGIPDTGDEGKILFKIDRDEQAHSYYDTSHPAVNEYIAPISLNELGVVGSVGSNGGPYGTSPGRTRDRYHRGIIDSFGDEWHILTYWDDEYGIAPVSSGHRQAMSDAKIVYLVVNATTPVISFEASDGEQYYTTPPKAYNIPVILPQTTYLTGGTMIQLFNIKDSRPIYYQIDGGEEKVYSQPFVASTIGNGRHTIEYWFDNEHHKTRELVINPDFPSRSEKHANLLWKDESHLSYIQQKFKRIPFAEVYSRWKSSIENNLSSLHFPLTERPYWRGWCWVAPHALNYAVPFYAENLPVASNPEFAKLSKAVLLDLFVVDPVGCESDHSNIPAPDRIGIPNSGQNAYIAAPLAYDLLIKKFKSTQHPEGITAIEDYKIRDNLASQVHMLMFMRANTRGAHSPSEMVGYIAGDMHWGLGYEMLIYAIGIAMPTYSTLYYGTSGFDGRKAEYPWTPFPNHPLTWWEVVAEPNAPCFSYPDNISIRRFELCYKPFDELMSYPHHKDAIWDFPEEGTWWIAANGFNGGDGVYRLGEKDPALLTEVEVLLIPDNDNAENYGLQNIWTITGRICQRGPGRNRSFNLFTVADANDGLWYTEYHGYESPFVSNLILVNYMHKLHYGKPVSESVEAYLDTKLDRINGDFDPHYLQQRGSSGNILDGEGNPIPLNNSDSLAAAVPLHLYNPIVSPKGQVHLNTIKSWIEEQWYFYLRKLSFSIIAQILFEDDETMYPSLPEDEDGPDFADEPDKTSMKCYNNVFNPTKGEEALIWVELSKQVHVKLSLYNTKGNRIRELANKEEDAGTHKYYWDGKNDSDNVVGSGLYFVHIQAGDYKKTKKIVVVK